VDIAEMVCERCKFKRACRAIAEVPSMERGSAGLAGGAVNSTSAPVTSALPTEITDQSGTVGHGKHRYAVRQTVENVGKKAGVRKCYSAASAIRAILLTMTLLVVLVLLLVIAYQLVRFFRQRKTNQEKLAAMTPIERKGLLELRAERAATVKWGRLNHTIICPQCHTKGAVRVRWEMRKGGVSGGKATAAILKGGTSLLLPGRYRWQEATGAHCHNCTSTWKF
jgi:hypothetical protein